MVDAATPKTVVVFRHTLLPMSETFIRIQAAHIKNFRVIYVGRERGTMALDGDVRLLTDGLQSSLFKQLARLIYTVRAKSRRMRAVIMGAAPSIVHAHFGVEGVYAWRTLKGSGIPIAVTFHGFDATRTLWSYLRSPKLSHLRYIWHRRSMTRDPAVHFIAVSDFIRDRLIARGFPRERVTVHHIGIDPRLFRLTRGAGTPRIVSTARLVEKKGTEYLIQAFARVVHSYPDAKLTLIGDGPLRDHLMALTRTLEIEQYVLFLGAQPMESVVENLAQSGVFALPSITAKDGDAEGMGLVLLEAAASGLPVVASLHGGMPDAVDPGVTGFLCPERDISCLQRALETLLADPDRAIQMGVAGREMVLRRFDVMRQSRALEQVFEQHILSVSKGVQ